MTNEIMTVEEAIVLLKEKRFEINCKVNGTTQFSKALEMAIRALEVVQWMEEVFLQELPELDMRDATEEERSSLKHYIDSISKSTGVKFDFNSIKTELKPCEDCVSREAVAEMLNEMPMKITETWMDFYRKALNSLNKLPSVTPKTSCESCREQVLKHLEKEDWADTVNCVMNMPFMKAESGVLIDKLEEGHDDAITAQIMWERDTAIEQLKQLGYGLGEKVEPCEDAISREAVEKITWEEPSYTDALNVLTEVREKIRQLPSVTPQQKWIPVSERLPEEDGEYFVSVRYKYVKGYESVCTEYGEWNDGSWIYDPEYCGEAEGIIAWMPLPQPYKAESEE